MRNKKYRLPLTIYHLLFDGFNALNDLNDFNELNYCNKSTNQRFLLLKRYEPHVLALVSKFT